MTKVDMKMSKVAWHGRPALAVGLILAPTSAGIGEREFESVCVRERVCVCECERVRLSE
jgi:hypothetical protein